MVTRGEEAEKVNTYFMIAYDSYTVTDQGARFRLYVPMAANLL